MQEGMIRVMPGTETIEFIEAPIVRSCREMIDALTDRVKNTDNPYAATQASASTAAIIKELRKAGFFDVPRIALRDEI